MGEREQKITALLKGIETGDTSAVAVVNPKKYIQHNPQTKEGGPGLAELFKRLAKTNPRVNIVRIFADGDYVFGHTEYDFSSARVGFEVFRFEGEQTVEHWDNIQSKQGPNASGHSMTDGDTKLEDLEQTELNRDRVRRFIESVYLAGDLARLPEFVAPNYIEHSPDGQDGLPSLTRQLRVAIDREGLRYQKQHHLLAQGNFVLSACEGAFAGAHSAFYDLYRLKESKILEHWSTREHIAPRSQWQNTNGKF